MSQFPNEKIVEQLRKEYPKGTRLSLVSMDDPYTKLEYGDKMTVDFIDDAGDIHGRWDNGEGLALVYGEDSFRKLTADELAQEERLKAMGINPATLEKYENEEQDIEEGPVMGM